MPYSKKEDKKSAKLLNKLAKEEKLKTGFAHPSNVSSVKDEKRSRDQEKKKNEKDKNR